MRRENSFTSNRDLRFYYEQVIDWQRLVPLFPEAAEGLSASEAAASWRDVLGLAGCGDEAELRPILAHAEHLAQMLAHLHIARLLAQQAERWPDRTRLAERFLSRTVEVCDLTAHRIRGDF